MKARRVTQRDVAQEAGVHRATVSMALRNHPNIPLETRQRILEIAQRLGYSPDPMLSALALYRNRQRPATFHGTLAWLLDSAGGWSWRERPHFVDYFQGATERARYHGFQLELFDLNTGGLSPARMASILRARSISGVLLCPQPQPHTALDFPWEEFSAVTFGYTLTSPKLHTVTAGQFRAMVMAMERIHQAGYKRIGLVLDDEHNLRADNNYLGGYLAGRHLAGNVEEVPPLTTPYEDVPAAVAWLHKHRPQVVVTCYYRFLETIAAAGLTVPDDVAVVCPVLPSTQTRLSGVVENNLRAGAVAVDFLVAMIQRGERGVPDSAERIHVEGSWWAGQTLPPAKQD